MKENLLFRLKSDIIFRIEDDELGFYSIQGNNLLFAYSIAKIKNLDILNAALKKLYYFLSVNEIMEMDKSIGGLINHLILNHADYITIENLDTVSIKNNYDAGCIKNLKENFIFFKEKGIKPKVNLDKSIVVLGSDLISIDMLINLFKDLGCKNVNKLVAHDNDCDMLIIIGRTKKHFIKEIEKYANENTIITHIYTDINNQNLKVGPTYCFNDYIEQSEKYNQIYLNQSNSCTILPLNVTLIAFGIILSDMQYILTDTLCTLSKDFLATLNRDIQLNYLSLDAFSSSYL